MVKKGYFRTIESIIAIMATFFFILIIYPEEPSDIEPEIDINLLEILSENRNFRNCVIANNQSCVNGYLSQNIDYYQYTFNISTDYSFSADINNDNVYLKTLFIAGNETVYSPRVLKLYYWVD